MVSILLYHCYRFNGNYLGFVTTFFSGTDLLCDGPIDGYKVTSEIQSSDFQRWPGDLKNKFLVHHTFHDLSPPPPPPLLPKKTELTSDVSLSLMFSAFDVNGNII